MTAYDSLSCHLPHRSAGALSSQRSRGADRAALLGLRHPHLVLHRLYPTLGWLPDPAQLAFMIAERILNTKPPEDPALAGDELTHDSI
jgi:hypothetical protein